LFYGSEKYSTNYYLNPNYVEIGPINFPKVYKTSIFLILKTPRKTMKQTLAFDVYGTLIDTAGVYTSLERIIRFEAHCLQVF